MPVKKFSLTKSYKRAHVHTWNGRELPKALLTEIMEVLGDSEKIKNGAQNKNLLKKSGPKRIDLIDGKALFSPSFNENYFNEPFDFYVNEKESILENPFWLKSRGECFSDCSHTTIEWGSKSLDVRIKHATLRVGGLVPADKTSRKLWNLLVGIESFEYVDALIESKLLNLSSIEADCSKRGQGNEFSGDVIVAELVSTLENRLSECLNLHFCDKIENRLDEDGDLSLVDGEEYLQIELDE